MIRLLDTELPTRTARYLHNAQQEVSNEPDYATRVEQAKRLWSAKTNSARKTFGTIHSTLTAAHHADPRCVYCGYSLAGEIDHFRPKSLYPEFVFVWENYVPSCRQCNGFKADKFAVFSDATTARPTVILRNHIQPNTVPVRGETVLIDPRREDPMDLLIIDLIPEPRSKPPYLYRPNRKISSREIARAEYTIEILGLNRDHLRRGRASAFNAYRTILTDYLLQKNNQDTSKRSQRLIEAIKDTPHRAVWEEMKRWHQSGWLSRIKELNSIAVNFAAAPEALEW